MPHASAVPADVSGPPGPAGVPPVRGPGAHVRALARWQALRRSAVHAPHVDLARLSGIDARLAAHAEALDAAGDAGRDAARHLLATQPGAARLFAAATLALRASDRPGLQALLPRAAASPASAGALAAALGWADASRLRGVVPLLLAQASPPSRALGLAACRLHRVDPGPPLHQALHDADAGLRIEALRCAAALGRTGLLPATLSLVDDAHPQVARVARQAAVLLGDRDVALRRLEASLRVAAFDDDLLTPALVLGAAPLERAGALLADMARRASGRLRPVVRAAGWLGDARLLPALIDRMSDPALARLAGEAFSMITGADLVRTGLHRAPPAGVATQASHDEDARLPWPDAGKVHEWWSCQAPRWLQGERLFLGAPLSLATCHRVLRDGRQRLRRAAAFHASLLAPGTPVFNTAAPAHRQAEALRRLPDPDAAPALPAWRDRPPHDFRPLPPRPRLSTMRPAPSPPPHAERHPLPSGR